MNVHLIHLLFIFHNDLGCILQTLRISKVSGEATQHFWKIVTIWVVAVGPSFLIFPRCNMVGHLRDKRFNGLQKKNCILVFNKQAVERLRGEVAKTIMMHDSTYTSSLIWLHTTYLSFNSVA